VSSRNVFAKITAKTRSIISKLQAGEVNQIPDLGMWFGVLTQLIIKKTIFGRYMNSKNT
jgi:hypothetical protein